MKNIIDQKIKDTRKRPYIIGINNPYKIYWDITVIMGALFTSFVAPVEIAFPDINEDFHKNTYMHSLDIIVDVIFLIDIFIGFITEYTDVSTGD